MVQYHVVSKLASSIFQISNVFVALLNVFILVIK